MRPLGVPRQIEAFRQFDLPDQQEDRRVLRGNRSPGSIATARTLAASGFRLGNRSLTARVQPHGVRDQQARAPAAVDEAQAQAGLLLPHAGRDAFAAQRLACGGQRDRQPETAG